MEEQFYTFILRHDTSTKWLVNDPILSLGEYGVEDDTHKVKRGDGESKWSELPYEDFGLQYIVTYANLHGQISDNEALQQLFDSKLSVRIFDDVNNSIVNGIRMDNETDVDGGIARITKTTKNITTNVTTDDQIIIKSSDKTVQGYWSIDGEGKQILNLVAECSISDYESGHKYFKDQLCFYNNKLYRAASDIEAGSTFGNSQWVVLASLHSNDIRYDNLVSGLDSDNVKDALDELKRRDDRKVQKSTEERIVYGTTAQGEQTVIPIDDLRKVDTVNHKSADVSKNIQLDSNDIKYNDSLPELGTIKNILDSKVDKNFAGENARIVRDVRITYNDETGSLTVQEDKVSPTDGSSTTEENELNIVSEQELATAIREINGTINTEVGTLNNRIDAEAQSLNTRIDTEVQTLNTTINTEVQTLNTKIDSNVSTLNTRIDTEVGTLNTKIDTIEQESKDRDDELDTKIDTEVETLGIEIDRVEQESKDRDNELDTKIDTEVQTLNNTIDTKETEIYQKIADEKSDLENTITDEVATLNQTITNMGNTKIDKNIATNIVTDIVAAIDSNEPTIKIERKNTNTKETIVNHLHFKASGDIQTRFVDADHILIDSSVIDGKIAAHTTRINGLDTSITAINSDIASLQQHDVNHDSILSSHTSQIANQETRLLAAENNIDDLGDAIDALDVKYDAKVTELKQKDTELSGILANHTIDLANHTQQIQTNADNITALNQLVTRDIDNLTQQKADKTFASATDNKVVGKLESDIIANNELFNLKQTLVSPNGDPVTTNNIKIISSDNTVVATRRNDGTIDLATNLDIDVNYFITPETISTTIAAETTLDMTQLTPTDKPNVEVQDIISDAEGTWGRVKSIDTSNNTCVVVTFEKQASAVWGTLRGTLADQQDLQAKFDDIENTTDALQSDINAINDIIINKNIYASKQPRMSDATGWINSLTKIGLHIDGSTSEKINHTATIQVNYVDPNGNADNYNAGSYNFYFKSSNNSIGMNKPFGTPDTIDIMVLPENVPFDKQSSGLTSTFISPAIRELKGIADTKVEQVSSVDIVYGTDSNGNQTTYNKVDFGKVDTVNNVQPDANKNVTLTASDIDVQMYGATQTISTMITNFINCIQKNVENSITKISSYVQGELYESSVNYLYVTGSLITTLKADNDRYVTFERDDGVILMAKIMRNFTSDDTEATAYDSFMADVNAGNLKLIGIPEQVGNTTPPTPPTPPEPADAQETFDALNDIMGTSDSYDGMGATEDEIVGVLDEILGNNE